MRSRIVCLVACLSFGIPLSIPFSVSAQVPGFEGGNLPYRSAASGGGSIVMGFANQNASPFAKGSFSGGNSYNVRVNNVLLPYLSETSAGSASAAHGTLWAAAGTTLVRTRNEGISNPSTAGSASSMVDRFTFTGPEGFDGTIDVTFYPVVHQFNNVNTFFSPEVLSTEFEDAGISLEQFSSQFVFDQHQTAGTLTASIQYQVFRRNTNGSLSQVSWIEQRKRSIVNFFPNNMSSNLTNTLEPYTVSLRSGQVVEIRAGVSILIEVQTASSLSDPVFSSSGKGAASAGMQVKMSALPAGWSVESIAGIRLQTYSAPRPEYPFPVDAIAAEDSRGWLDTWMGEVWVDFDLYPYVFQAEQGWLALYTEAGGAYFSKLSSGDQPWMYSEQGFYPLVYNVDSARWEQWAMLP